MRFWRHGGFAPTPFRHVALLVAVLLMTVTTGTELEAHAAPRSVHQSMFAGGQLAAMLLRAPDVLDDPAPNAFHLASFADLAAFRASAGAEATPTAAALALPPVVALHGAEANWRTTFGYSLAQVDQTLLIGDPLDAITVLRGRFVEAELRNAWVRAGYQAIELDGATVWSLAADGSLDVSSPLGRLSQATHNNAILLPDGTLVFATRLAHLRAVVAVDQGREAALGTRPSIDALLAQFPRDTISALLVATAWLVASGEDQGTAGIPTSNVPLTPPVRLALLSVSSSPTPLRMALLLDDAPSARTTLRLWMNRLEADNASAEPLRAAGWALDSVERIPGQPVVAVWFQRLPNAPPTPSLNELTRQELRIMLG